MQPMESHSFKIINAAAGAGKTFALVKQYLLLLLSANQPPAFQHILALTFTNKAVAEMKGRILKMLWSLAHNPKTEVAMCEALLKELPLNQEQLQAKSLLVLRKIFKDYGRFEVITLDKLTYSIVRTFAKDLHLPHQFEVVLQQKEVLLEMVHKLMDEIGTNDSLTQMLLTFSEFKMSQDKNWDVEKELMEMAESLLKENDRQAVETLQQMDKSVWGALKTHFVTLSVSLEQQLVTLAEETLREIEQQGLTPDDFFKKTFYNHFKKISEKQFEGRFKNQLEQALLGEKPLYKKTTPPAAVATIEDLRSYFTTQFENTRRLIGQWLLSQAIIKQWTPMALLREMEQRLNDLQQENQMMLLGQFNSRISKIVQEQPVPFIYERLGAQYRHFFIDEFQDTSVLQWENLIPLVGNALESETSTGERGSLFLVGDPKQAIYRWRGGNNQQFLNLLYGKSPFQIDPLVSSLQHNYRSCDQLIHFNNDFFKSILNRLSSPSLKRLFEESAPQLPTSKKGGMVSLSFLPKGLTKAEALPEYVSKTLAHIREASEAGYTYEDMAILVRTGEQAKEMGAALLANNIPFLSQETLYLAEAANVQFLIQLLQLEQSPQEKHLQKGLLDYVWHYGPGEMEDYHSFANTCLSQSTYGFFELLNQQFESTFKLKTFQKLSLYEAILYALSSFSFLQRQDAFMLYFLDYTFEFSLQKGGTKTGFLTHWEQESASLKIAQPEGENAVQIMTIHKAKGLEFSVVILPFLDKELHSKRAFPIWFPLREEPYSKLPWAWISFSQKIQEFGPEGISFFQAQQQAQEADALNVLYVALTRAKERLYILTTNSDEKTLTYAHLLKQYVLQKGKAVEDHSVFCWGDSSAKASESESKKEEEALQLQGNLNWVEKLILTNNEGSVAGLEARQEGLLLHRLMEKIDRATPEKIVAEEPLLQGAPRASNRQYYTALMEEMINHPQLKNYYNTKATVYCEHEILVPQERTLRPDRLVVHADHAALIDYKTGTPKNEDALQMLAYEKALQAMGSQKIKKFLVYTQNELIVKELD